MEMKKEYDVIVIGGGPGGVSAAVGAAKEGVSVLLIERYGFLGGMATAGLVNPFMRYRLEGKRMSTSVFNELLDRLKSVGALADDGQIFDDEVMKIVLDQMVGDYGIDLLLHSILVDAKMDVNRITTVKVFGKSGPMDIAGKIFIDSTGDGDLSKMAGASIEIGRSTDGLCQPMTLCFRIGGISGNLSPQALSQELTAIYLDAKEAGEIDMPREDVLIFGTLVPHIYHFNTTRIVQCNPTDTVDLTQAEVEGRRQVSDLLALFKQRSPHFKDAYLIKMAPQIGVRESRRVMGEYTLTMSDVIEGCKFPDGIARSNYPVDIHNPSGGGTILQYLQPGDYYEIPYRCLVPAGIANLLVGSRCISATHEAHASLRIMPVVAGIGEAAGMAAAWSVRQEILPRQIDGHKLKDTMFG
jgi:hypothetical protein